MTLSFIVFYEDVSRSCWILWKCLWFWLDIAKMSLGFVKYCRDVWSLLNSAEMSWSLLNTAKMSLVFIEYCRDVSGFVWILWRFFWVHLAIAKMSLGLVIYCEDVWLDIIFVTSFCLILQRCLCVSMSIAELALGLVGYWKNISAFSQILRCL